ncbi:MAG: HAD-IA family hydrolase [Phycisphaeraceae bacterium]
MTRPHAILFDLDGTLIDSLADIASAANASLRDLAQPTHHTPDYRMMVGDGADVLMRRALPADQQHLADEGLALFKQHYAQHVADETALYEGMDDTLDALTERGFPMAIVTNKPQAAADQIAAKLLTRWTWVCTTGHCEGVPKKPDPTSALAAAEAAGVAPGRCLFVGDSKTDMLTATAAGMVAVGVTWGFRDRAELVAHDAAHVIDHPQELLTLLPDNAVPAR